MMKRGFLNALGILAVIGLFVAGCCPALPSVLPTATPVPLTPAPISTPTPVPPAFTPTPAGPTPTPPPAPAPGTGNVTGRVLWNDQPVQDAEVKLCEDIKILGGCEGLELSATTDQLGGYFFANVPAGEYVVLARIPGEETWTYRTKIARPIKDTVEEGKTLAVEDLSTIKSDLKMTIPADDEEIETTTPILEWEPYPEAAYYTVAFQYETLNVVLLSGDRGRTDEPRLDVSTILPEPLLSGKYVWWVEAYNANRTQIAESRHHYHFIVAGKPPLFKLVSPADGEVVRAMPLTLTWEAWPGAAYYKVYLTQTEPKYEMIVDFVRTSENSYTVPTDLEPGKYHWAIDAYDVNDRKIATNEGIIHFSVAGQ